MVHKKVKRPKKEAALPFEAVLARDLRKIVWWSMISFGTAGIAYLLVEFFR
ncbi:hypothetical protein C8P63_12267 [Melghirimyces profundicolus]|uniref:Uncharacterized protein n=1 Tax=Melghirimyces profundicolus TaxID=1242148 RepID=A0A2T6BGC2_9BACL|nr:hypothetical protein [Melghirimyces profundicolus]PTX55107.1 hypothetical protein C8P63_12267 [Melghirimyces profundicolus]